jgi:cell wall-associated NlpC family hydrolase
MRLAALLAILVLSAALAAGCASASSVLAGPAPFPGAIPAPVVASSEASAPVRLANDILETALEQRGAPYRLGGSEPEGGFDCSGLVQYVFGQHHVGLPRTVARQYGVGRRVKRDQVQRGDLLFFGPAGRPPTHVAIAIDEDTFVHAPDTGAVVRVERLDAAYWKRRFAGARRVL